MATITVRELARNTAAVLQEVETTGRPALVTRHGRPVAALVAIDEAALEDWLLARAPELTRAGAAADDDLSSSRVQSDTWQRAQDREAVLDPAGLEAPADHLRGSHRGN